MFKGKKGRKYIAGEMVKNEIIILFSSYNIKDVDNYINEKINGCEVV